MKHILLAKDAADGGLLKKDAAEAVDPKAATIKVRANADTAVDDKKWGKDQEGFLTPAQFAAVGRYFTKLASALLLLALLALFAAPAQAQQYGTGSAVTYITTNSVILTNASTLWNLTNLSAAVVNATKYTDFALTIRFRLTGSGSDYVKITNSYSIDGTNWSTSPQTNLSQVANGTNWVQWDTNITMNAMGYFRIDAFGGSTNAPVTNLTIIAVKKPSRNGN